MTPATLFWEAVQQTMADSEQEAALRQVQAIYGKDGGFTEDHVHYRLVGFKKKQDRMWAVGDTWKQALENLAFRVLNEKA